MRATIYKHPTLPAYKVLINGTVYFYSQRKGWQRSRWPTESMGRFKLCCHVNNFKPLINVKS